MFFNLKRKLNTAVFNFVVRNIVNLPMVESNNDSNVVIASQLCSRDLYMYLVAIKTFTRYVVPSKVVIVADRLNHNEKVILKEQIKTLEIIDIQDVNTIGFPKGGTWERLLTIIDLSEKNYVIQLDADTITLSDPIAVKESIAQNRSFTLGTDQGRDVISFNEATLLMKQLEKTSQHVQIQAELAMSEIDQGNQLKYIRGCSGFSGFGKNQQSREKIKKISNAMENKIGKTKWSEWGSEQVSSNIVVANSNNPLVLPIKMYNYFKPGINLPEFNFLHFVGDYRFQNGEYWNIARKELIKLKNV